MAVTCLDLRALSNIVPILKGKQSVRPPILAGTRWCRTPPMPWCSGGAPTAACEGRRNADRVARSLDCRSAALGQHSWPYLGCATKWWPYSGDNVVEVVW